MTKNNLASSSVNNAVFNSYILEYIEKHKLKYFLNNTENVSLKNDSLKEIVDDLITAFDDSVKVLLLDEDIGVSKRLLLASTDDNSPVIIDITFTETVINIDAYSGDRGETGTKITEFLKKYTNDNNPKDESNIKMNFWTFNGRNGTHYSRDLVADKLTDITSNYTDDVSENLVELKDNLFKRNGKLVIFSGPPGTGKTTAIRSLMREWASKCKGDYVIDPENFFVGPPTYMTDLLLKKNIFASFDEWEDDLLENEIENDNKKKIIIIEDCASLISDRAKEESGHGLARLLNIVDGMIGQGLDILVILTTNEEIHTFNEAITREGRVHTMIEFEKFDVEKTKEWLTEHDLEISDSINERIKKSDGLSLAECYDLLNKDKEKSVKITSSLTKRNPVGFTS